MASSSLNVDLFMFLASGLSEENMEKSRITLTTRCSDPVLVQMLMKSTLADITLVARGGSIQAHTCVLATVSSAFAIMFNNGKREHLIYAVDSITDIETLQLFVLLIYISCEERMNPAMLELREAVDRRFRPLYEMAMKYEVMKRLSAVFADALPRNLSPENCWYFYRISAFALLKDICHQYILCNFKKVIASKRVVVEMNRNPELVQSFMILAASDKCGCTSVKMDQEDSEDD